MAAGIVSISVSDVAHYVSNDTLVARGLMAASGTYGQVVARRLRRKATRQKWKALAAHRRLADFSVKEDVRTLLADVAEYARDAG